MRLMYAHYVTAFLLLAAAIYHSLEMHYDWKDSVHDESQKHEFSWFDDVIKNEVLAYLQVLTYVALISLYLYKSSEPASTELFM